MTPLEKQRVMRECQPLQRHVYEHLADAYRALVMASASLVNSDLAGHPELVDGIEAAQRAIDEVFAQASQMESALIGFYGPDVKKMRPVEPLDGPRPWWAL